MPQLTFGIFQVNKNDYKLTFEDSGQWASGNFTTWGRIRSTEPLDDKTNSLPELGANPRVKTVEQRPSSLLATFVDRQNDYEYSELYIGNGRYVDLNDNEIGFVPRSTTAMQSADRWKVFERIPENKPIKTRRTFADLEFRAPPLDFMAMEHQVCGFCCFAREQTNSYYQILPVFLLIEFFEIWSKRT